MRSVDTPINLLLSFAYGGKAQAFAAEVFGLAKENRANVMIDSGAFTAFNNKGYDFLTLDNYCKFLDTWADCAEKYVMLDKIGDDAGTRRNYETMLARGYNPMFVVTMFDNDWGYIKNAVDHNRHLCVAGGATVKNDWLVQRFQRVMKATDNRARIHGLAYVTFPKMMMLNLESVDSSSWVQSSQTYGNTGIFYPDGIKQLDKKSVVSRLKRKEPVITRVMDELKVRPEHFDLPDFKSGAASVITYISVAEHLKMQRYVYRRGLRLFFAIGNRGQLRQVRYFIENPKPSYESFVKYVRQKEEN